MPTLEALAKWGSGSLFNMAFPNFKYERVLWQKGFTVIGTDEVGRGCFAGPVYAGAVCFDGNMNDTTLHHLESCGINDSKKLTPKERDRLAKLIKSLCLSYSISSSAVSFINKFGIIKATHAAQRDAINKLRLKLLLKNIFILSDAFYIKYLSGIGLKNQKAIIRGDSISISIAAASIIAKVERDRLMKSLSKKFPFYYWGENKGYATRKHQEAILRLGSTKLHRTKYVETFLSNRN